MTAQSNQNNHYQGQVKPEWLDYNDHMNLAYYVLAFDLATDFYYKGFGIAEDHIKQQKRSMFTTEINVSYHKELRLGDSFYIKTWLQDHNDKLIHYLHQMYNQQHQLVASNECLAIYVDMETRRSTYFPASIKNTLSETIKNQQRELLPEDIEWRLGIRR
ncbi:MAG: hypothetical protein DRQ47_10265 [Gammaproteobacteria bacterium]|nr:MAG: hypothetical protein DRQ47_10265 [Gammaproteobacteria bacterium]